MSYHILEYIWIDGFGELRSKIRVNKEYIDQYNLDSYIWNYDGSSCNQAATEDSEVILKPVAIYNNPFIEKSKDYESFLLLCDSVDKNGNSVVGTNYQYANKIFENERVKNANFWFGIEQEYFFIDTTTNLPYDFKPYQKNKHLLQGKYYCGVGGNSIYSKQRQIAEKHMMICLSINIPISGINAEVAPNQWEYQVGPCIGIKGAHDLWISRYVLKKIAEQYDSDVTFHPKPIRSPEFEECWNGSGAHINVSTKDTRSENGLDTIYQYMKLLKSTHQDHLEVYGKDNEYRLTGDHETGNINEFTFGIGTRNTSIRIPNQIAFDKKGYFEDRRPSSNVDPYLACGIIAKTICL
jgi:glutamine synthetase